MKSTQIRLAARPVGEPDAGTFETVSVELPALADGEVLPVSYTHLTLPTN